LKMGDRIVSLDGRQIENAKAYLDLMAKYTESKSTVATVQRGKDRIRLETSVVLPKRDAVVTARVQGDSLPAEREVRSVSRTVKEMKVPIPPRWAGESRLAWTGLALEKIEAPGCYLLTIEKDLLRAAKCQ